MGTEMEAAAEADVKSPEELDKMIFAEADAISEVITDYLVKRTSETNDYPTDAGILASIFGLAIGKQMYSLAACTPAGQEGQAGTRSVASTMVAHLNAVADHAVNHLIAHDGNEEG